MDLFTKVLKLFLKNHKKLVKVAVEFINKLTGITLAPLDGF